MTHVSIELVPRSPDSLRADLQVMREHLPAVRMVNIPDLLGFELRSWEACRQARAALPRAIPHLRAMDVDLEHGVRALVETLRAADLHEVLVVQGDRPQDLHRPVFPTRSVELIRALKAALPAGGTVYAAVDPYRASFRAEMDYLEAKLEAGADGFFTQPFFDLRLMDVWAELLAGHTVYWGVSPVLAERTRRYWQTKNNAFFPAAFVPTLEWNRRFAVECLAWVRARGAHIYYMPIRADLREYLGGIL
jgi:methylenetetrahydrofolate reductase (NADPH)